MNQSTQLVLFGHYVTIPIYRKTEESFQFVHFGRLTVQNIHQVWFCGKSTYTSKVQKTINVFGHTFKIPFRYDTYQVPCSHYQIVYSAPDEIINGKKVQGVRFLKSTVDPLVYAASGYDNIKCIDSEIYRYD